MFALQTTRTPNNAQISLTPTPVGNDVANQWSYDPVSNYDTARRLFTLLLSDDSIIWTGASATPKPIPEILLMNWDSFSCELCMLSQWYSRRLEWQKILSNSRWIDESSPNQPEEFSLLTPLLKRGIQISNDVKFTQLNYTSAAPENSLCIFRMLIWAFETKYWVGPISWNTWYPVKHIIESSYRINIHTAFKVLKFMLCNQ